jgi:hypothetical protein
LRLPLAQAIKNNPSVGGSLTTKAHGFQAFLLQLPALLFVQV